MVCTRVPQQSNAYDCGLFMLQFIRALATQPLPSFESVDGLVAHFDKAMFTDEDIVCKREQLRDDIAALVKKDSGTFPIGYYDAS